MNRCLVFGLGILALAAAFAVRLSAQDAPPSREEIDALVQELGSTDAATRDAATESLRKIGEPALPALRDAAQSSDAEVATRAQQLLAKLEKTAPDPADREQQRNARRRAPRGGFNQGFSITFGGPGSVQIQQDADGHVRVSITEQKDGKTVTEPYEASSPEEFKEKYPEVSRKYGIGQARGRFNLPPFGIQLPDPSTPEEEGNDPAWGGFDEQLRKQLEGQMRGFQKQLQEMLRRFGRPGLDPKRVPPPQEDLLPGPDEEEEDTDMAEPEETPQPPRPAPRPARRPAAPKAPELGVGVEYIEPALRAHLQLEGEEGVMVSDVKTGSLAEQAGLERYDVLLQVNGQSVKTQWEFRRLVKEALAAGKDFNVELIRGGKRRTVLLHLGSAPGAPEPEKKGDKSEEPDRNGSEDEDEPK